MKVVGRGGDRIQGGRVRKVIVVVISSILALPVNISVCIWLCLTGQKRKLGR